MRFLKFTVFASLLLVLTSGLLSPLSARACWCDDGGTLCDKFQGQCVGIPEFDCLDCVDFFNVPCFDTYCYWGPGPFDYTDLHCDCFG